MLLRWSRLSLNHRPQRVCRAGESQIKVRGMAELRGILGDHLAEQQLLERLGQRLTPRTQLPHRAVFKRLSLHSRRPGILENSQTAKLEARTILIMGSRRAIC